MSPSDDAHSLAPVILIGPMSAGKSTIAELLAQELGLPRHGLDDVRWDYYAEVGYDSQYAKKLAEEEGPGALLNYWKPFEAHAVERVLQEYADGVVDFGAGHSVHEDPALFARVQRAMAPYPHIILLLPSPDLDESVAILNERLAKMLVEQAGFEEAHPEVLAANETFIRHPSNFQLARLIVYTRDRSPQETTEEIIRWLQSDPSPSGP